MAMCARLRSVFVIKELVRPCILMSTQPCCWGWTTDASVLHSLSALWDSCLEEREYANILHEELTHLREGSQYFQHSIDPLVASVA